MKRTRRQLVSLTDGADSINVSTRTLRRYIAAGRLSAYRVGPRLIMVDLNELDDVLQRVGGTAQFGR